MKIIKKSILLGSIAVVGAIGCGTVTQNSENTQAKATESFSETEAQKESIITDSGLNTENQNTVKSTELQYQSYKQIMMMFLNQKYLPEYGDMTNAIEGDMSDNTFSIADIDGDGSNELLISFTSAITAAQSELIYDYDPKTNICYKEFMEYPLLSFYENGAIEAGWSHNQGNAGDFWPYSLYIYDRDKDTYSEVGSVDAYDKKIYEQNTDSLKDNPFPEDIDTDKNGFVYYLYDKDMSNYENAIPVDDSAYNDWIQKYTSGSDKIMIEYLPLTAENISNIK